MKYLKDLIRKVEKISLRDGPCPDTQREPEDSFVGTIPMELRKLWAAWKIVEAEAIEKNQEGDERFGDLSDEEKDLRRDEIMEAYLAVILTANEAVLLEKCFWTSVRQMFPKVATADMIGIRKGWQIVKVNQVKRIKDIAQALLKEIANLEDEGASDE